MRAAMHVIFDRSAKAEPRAQRLKIKLAREIHPLAAILAPRLPAIGFADLAGVQLFFERAEMLAEQAYSRPASATISVRQCDSPA